MSGLLPAALSYCCNPILSTAPRMSTLSQGTTGFGPAPSSSGSLTCSWAACAAFRAEKKKRNLGQRR